MSARSSNRPLAGLSLAMLLPSLGTSIANAGLPEFAASFGAHVQDVQWIVLSYLLVMTALVVGAGRLGDLMGRRRLLLVGIAVFAAGSALAAAAGTLWLVIAARALQGAGAAMMMALATAMVGDVVPKKQTGWAMGLLGTASAVGTALGPSLGGMLIGVFGWRAMFVLLAALAAAAFVALVSALPTQTDTATRGRKEPFDVTGTILLAAALGLYALSMTIGRGAFGAINIAILGAAAIGFAAFALAQTWAASPLIEMRWLRDRQIGMGLAGTGLVATIMMTTLVVGPFFLAGVLDLSPAAVGLVMSAGPVMAALAGVPAGRLVDRFGTTSVALAGLAVMIAGSLTLALLAVRTGAAGYAASVALLAAGYALFQAANTTAIMRDVPAERRGVISGLLNLARNLGLITGASAMAALFAVASHPGSTAATPATIAAATALTFAVGGGLAILTAALVLVANGWESGRRNS